MQSELAQCKIELSQALNLVGSQQKELRELYETNTQVHRFLMTIYEKQRHTGNYDTYFYNELEPLIQRVQSSLSRLKRYL